VHGRGRTFIKHRLIILRRVPQMRHGAMTSSLSPTRLSTSCAVLFPGGNASPPQERRPRKAGTASSLRSSLQGPRSRSACPWNSRSSTAILAGSPSRTCPTTKAAARSSVGWRSARGSNTMACLTGRASWAAYGVAAVPAARVARAAAALARLLAGGDGSARRASGERQRRIRVTRLRCPGDRDERTGLDWRRTWNGVLYFCISVHGICIFRF